MSATTLLPGFADPVSDAQSAFRALLEAMSRPGRVQRIARPPRTPDGLEPAMAALLLVLADSTTPCWLDAGEAAAAWLRFHAGCPLVEGPGDASFVAAVGAAPPLLSLRPGGDADPHESATLLLRVEALEEGDGWRLRGPGIEREHRLRVAGAPSGFVADWARNRARFPRGVDAVLCAGDRIAALPRGVLIEEG